MLYYRVIKTTCIHRLPHILFENELFTEKELNKYGLNPQSQLFEAVNIPKNKIYWMFGVRKQRKQSTD